MPGSCQVLVAVTAVLFLSTLASKSAQPTTFTAIPTLEMTQPSLLSTFEGRKATPPPWNRNDGSQGEQQQLATVQLLQTQAQAPPAPPSLLCPSSMTPDLPPPKPQLYENESLPPIYSIFACKGLALAYIHVFKSGGSSVSTDLSAFCEKTTGEGLVNYFSWRNMTLESLDVVCNNGRWLCFTFYWDPVDRFLSGYHEIMKRDLEADMAIRLPFLRLPPNATQEERVEKLHVFLEMVEEGKLPDPHIRPQSWFLRNKGDGQLASRGLAFFDLERYDEMIRRLFCGALADCLTVQSPSSGSDTKGSGNSSKGEGSLIEELGQQQGGGGDVTRRRRLQFDCPLQLSDGHRARLNEEYGLPQYLVHERELPDEIVSRIVGLYAEDYCFFGLKKHPRAVQEPRCENQAA